jgi:hypothetical protein
MRDTHDVGNPKGPSGSGTPEKSPAQASTAQASTLPKWARATRVRAGGGVRSGAPANLQLVCDTGIYSVDAALQPRDVPGWFVLGQVFLRNNEPAEQLEVVLHEDDVAGQVLRTDAFGEFSFTSRARKSIGVALHGPELGLVELWRGD